MALAYDVGVMAPIIICTFLAVLLMGFTYATNPFSRFSVVRRPYIVRRAGEDVGVEAEDYNHRLRVYQSWPWRMLAVAKCGLYIVTTRYFHSPRARSTTVRGIIGDIHRHRFRPERLLVISGDHFTSLFVRNLGVFYYPLLDACFPSEKDDWHDRQAVYLQTVAYALGVFSKHPVPTTTIVPAGAYRATCVNFYAYPSDTVYGILYALAVLQGKQQPYPGSIYGKPLFKLQTQAAADKLASDYRATLVALYGHYRRTAYDGATGLVSKDVHMSGAKDITRRRSAFYDNVIFWKTTALAMELGIVAEDAQFLAGLKARILETFWLPGEGYFLEDLSDEGVAGKYYSSDWLIVLAVGFLDPAKKSEQQYFVRSIAYIRAHKVDAPFAIKYQHETRASRQFLAVRLAVASYGGDAIWSFWGMEYIKALMILYEATGERRYLRIADGHIGAYQRTMVRDSGFPEVYDSSGKLLQKPLYRSIRQTGWVVGFEQVLAMRQLISG